MTSIYSDLNWGLKFTTRGQSNHTAFDKIYTTLKLGNQIYNVSSPLILRRFTKLCRMRTFHGRMVIFPKLWLKVAGKINSHVTFAWYAVNSHVTFTWYAGSLLWCQNEKVTLRAWEPEKTSHGRRHPDVFWGHPWDVS